MKVVIKLSKAEVKGIKQYLKDVDDNPKPSKHDVIQFIEGIVQAIHAPQEAVSSYIQAEEGKLK